MIEMLDAEAARMDIILQPNAKPIPALSARNLEIIVERLGELSGAVQRTTLGLDPPTLEGLVREVNELILQVNARQ